MIRKTALIGVSTLALTFATMSAEAGTGRTHAEAHASGSSTQIQMRAYDVTLKPGISQSDLFSALNKFQGSSAGQSDLEHLLTKFGEVDMQAEPILSASNQKVVSTTCGRLYKHQDGSSDLQGYHFSAALSKWTWKNQVRVDAKYMEEPSGRVLPVVGDTAMNHPLYSVISQGESDKTHTQRLRVVTVTPLSKTAAKKALGPDIAL